MPRPGEASSLRDANEYRHPAEGARDVDSRLSALASASQFLGLAPREEPLVHGFLGRVRAVVERTEPLVQRHGSVTAIVHLEILVMQVVNIVRVVDLGLPGEDDLVEARVALRWHEGKVLQVVHDVQGMRRDDPMQEDPGKIEDVFDRVHSEARPRSDIDVLVMQVVDRPIERRPMDEAMDQVKVKFSEGGNDN